MCGKSIDTDGFCSQRIGNPELWYFLSCYCWPSVQRCHWSPVISPCHGTVVRSCDILMPAWTICWTQVELPVFWKPMVLKSCLYRGIFNTGSNVIIGIKYRMPNSSVDIFNERLSWHIGLQKEHKLCFLLGDLNIDFWKLMTIGPRAKYLVYYIAAMYFPWSRHTQE